MLDPLNIIKYILLGLFGVILTKIFDYVFSFGLFWFITIIAIIVIVLLILYIIFSKKDGGGEGREESGGSRVIIIFKEGNKTIIIIFSIISLVGLSLYYVFSNDLAFFLLYLIILSGTMVIAFYFIYRERSM
ncbi:MAG: hypothetical protein ACFFDF_17650 [Candidatus Odinarchaeota archaeon]